MARQAVAQIDTEQVPCHLRRIEVRRNFRLGDCTIDEVDERLAPTSLSCRNGYTHVTRASVIGVFEYGQCDGACARKTRLFRPSDPVFEIPSQRGQPR